VKWNLRLAAANRGIWKASELQRMLAGAGLVISAGKMSGTSAQAIREDRILHEALATEGDIRRLGDLFGLTVGGAERYAHTTGEPGSPSASPVGEVSRQPHPGARAFSSPHRAPAWQRPCPGDP
jgi:hypothetical protein